MIGYNEMSPEDQPRFRALVLAIAQLVQGQPFLMVENALLTTLANMTVDMAAGDNDMAAQITAEAMNGLSVLTHAVFAMRAVGNFGIDPIRPDEIMVGKN